MKRYVAIQILLLICLLVTLPSLSTAEDGRRDGNWWNIQDQSARAAYIVGFFDGMTLGQRFSYWSFAKNKKMNACLEKVLDSYTEYSSKYFNNVTNGQIVDGLNSFYADYRNRRIKIADAVWLVVNGIAGTPQKELDTMTESWRRNAN